MSILKKSILVAVATSMVSIGANAAVQSSDNTATVATEAQGSSIKVLANNGIKPYVGVNLGALSVDDNDALDKELSYGATVGVTSFSGFGVELDYNQVDTADIKEDGAKVGTAKYNNWGVAGVYRHNLTDLVQGAYLKGKLGINEGRLKTKVDGVTNTETDANVTAGAGIGYNFTENVSAEVSYDRFSSDVELVGVSANFSF